VEKILSKESSETAKTQDFFKAGFVITLWSLMVWLVLMNTSMFNVALPSIISELDITPATVSWIVTGYSIVLAISPLPTAGFLISYPSAI